MTDNGDQPEKDRGQYAFNLTLAAVAGQVGCITVVIIIISLLAGLWMDNRFETTPLFTIILLVLSMPVTLITMFKVVRATTARMNFDLPPKNESPQEEVEFGRERED
ncbi:MAG: AtpZ/AtpI family protein [Chloroflexi bacterium]|nr:AtpZ/AtpI family protein [Chloroflexota bacterium]